MADIETVKIKREDGKGYIIINKDDFDEKKHTLAADDGEPEERSVMSTRNASGTYSEPTPTDIRYPDKDATEFENNHGAFLNKSAAEIREASGLPDAPGGVMPTDDIPDDWENLSVAQKRILARKLTGREDREHIEADDAHQIIKDRASVKREKGGKKAEDTVQGAAGAAVPAAKVVA